MFQTTNQMMVSWPDRWFDDGSMAMDGFMITNGENC